MRLIILGAPGAGKGTQADIISQKLNIPHISTGDIFRENIKNQTELGRIAKEYMDKGSLVPDEITIDMVGRRLKEKDCVNGFILDGFPRTVAQANALEDKLAKDNLKIDMVLNIEAADELILERMIGRRVCSNCKATYHIIYTPPVIDGKCNTCGTALIQRVDDTEETVKKRMSVYHEQTEPLIQYYKERKLLTEINGEGEVKSISEKIFKVLDKLG
ncbi:MAG: adenylate kinase [Deltaproteobacteria bacterium]